MYKKITLKNGLRIVLVPREDTSVFTAMIVFKVGSVNENKKLGGISHYLEHLAYKGTKKRPTAKDVAEFVDGLGGEHNAFTGKEHTAYYVKAASEHLPKVLDFLSDNLTNSTYNEAELNRERTVILEELKMYEDIPQAKASELFELAALGDTSLGRPIIGNSKSVKNISRKDIIQYHNQHYHCENAVLAIAGNFKKFSQKSIVERVEMLFKLKPTKQNLVNKFIQPKNFIPQISNKKTEQSNIIIGFLGPNINHKDWYTSVVLAKILGGSMSSRMFSEIREKMGLTYNISTDFRSYTATGLFVTQAGVANNKVYLASKAIIKEYQKIAQKLAGQSELARAKEMLKGGLLIDMEDSEELACGFAMDEILRGKIETPEETIAMYNKVTLDDVLECAKTYFKPEKIIFAGVGPVIEIKKINQLLNIAVA